MKWWWRFFLYLKKVEITNVLMIQLYKCENFGFYAKVMCTSKNPSQILAVNFGTLKFVWYYSSEISNKKLRELEKILWKYQKSKIDFKFSQEYARKSLNRKHYFTEHQTQFHFLCPFKWLFSIINQIEVQVYSVRLWVDFRWWKFRSFSYKIEISPQS